MRAVVRSSCRNAWLYARRHYSTAHVVRIQRDGKLNNLNEAVLSRLVSPVHSRRSSCFRNLTGAESPLHSRRSNSASNFLTVERCPWSNSKRSVFIGRNTRIPSKTVADSITCELSEEEIKLLHRSLVDLELEHTLENLEKGYGAVDKPPLKELMRVVLVNSIPFVAFGFLDNAIMITVGDYVDSTVGVTLGISTMAAAAIGNTISDAAGIGLAGWVEILCSKLGLKQPDLTIEQLSMRSAKISEYVGMGLGIAVGCFIGMFPLLFMKDKKCAENHHEDS